MSLLKSGFPVHQTRLPVQNFIFVKVEKNYFKLNFSDILYIQSDKKYISITTTNRSYVALASLSHIEKLLPKETFCRIHKSFIISLENASKFDSEFVYVGNKKIPISENYKGVLKDSVVIVNCETKSVQLDNGNIDKLIKDINS